AAREAREGTGRPQGGTGTARRALAAGEGDDSADGEAAGADGIVATNTLSGMIIDIDARRPILTNKVGGIAGPAMKPVAMKVVWQLYGAVKIPIIGTGGVTTGRDVIEYIMAGATAVGVGAAIYYGGIDVFKNITAEMETYMTENKITSLEEIRGVAHQI
ncbi:MAG: alpha-hydroxy-acid oxidizing protein, partial [Weeksellaceae bacterium]